MMAKFGWAERKIYSKPVFAGEEADKSCDNEAVATRSDFTVVRLARDPCSHGGAPQPPEPAEAAHFSSLRLSHTRHGPSIKAYTLPKPLSLLRRPSKPATSKSPLRPTPTKASITIEPCTASQRSEEHTSELHHT